MRIGVQNNSRARKDLRTQLSIDYFEKDRAARKETFARLTRQGESVMANKEAKKALEQFKMQAANEVGVNLNQGYNGDLTARQAGSVGGQMVKKMIEPYENSLKTK